MTEKGQRAIETTDNHRRNEASCLQTNGLYLLFLPVLYLGEDESEMLNEPFKIKLEIAVGRIIEPLQLVVLVLSIYPIHNPQLIVFISNII
jgi:hypothetical protein